MKLLTLVRHAKSDWDNNLNDFDRPLNIRGTIDAPRMGAIASELIPKADRLISSPAERAKATAFYFADSLNYLRENISFDPLLYHCGITEYLEFLSTLNNNLKHVYIFSHNPGTTNFTNFLCNESIFNVPTCGVIHIAIEINTWEEISRDSGKIKHFLTPKMFR